MSTLQVCVVSDISRPVAAVWDKAAAFCAIAAWHPFIAESGPEAEPGPNGGLVRTLTTRDGETLQEELLSCDHVARRIRYAITDSPFPVSFYRAEILVSEKELADSCRITWTAEFEPENQADGPRLHRLFEDEVFRAGIHALASDPE
ncbi:SRPBCC family protein [Streptomyces sp. f150]|uniref:SRPBCC family protein n=1 Tax=Streptomyces sp. f150 TaxID=1827699 RepID=UPI000BF04667|nr:SRPBCC family protein [Streptomyces sp. f150]